MGQIMNFIISEKGYIIVVLVTLVVAFFVSKKNLYDEEDKPGSSLKITVTMFILVMVGIAGYIISFGANISDANKLSTIASFTAPFIAFSGAYLIFEFGQKKADKEKKLENVKKLEYKKVMLYNFLESTIVGTSKLVKELHHFSCKYGDVFKEEDRDICRRVQRLMDTVAKDKYDDMFYFTICGIVYAGSNENFTLPKNIYGRRLQCNFNELIEMDRIDLSRLLYDENWTTYLDCLNDHKKIQIIINWVNLLRNNSQGFNVIDFLRYRNEVIKLIDEEYPEVKDGSIRGIMESVEKILETIT